jgi:hypothetical protein
MEQYLARRGDVTVGARDYKLFNHTAQGGAGKLRQLLSLSTHFRHSQHLLNLKPLVQK